MTELKNLYSHLFGYAEERPNDAFLFDESRSFTVAECLYTCVSIANRLYDLGLRESSLVALRATRSLDTAILWLSLEFLGATVALTDPHDNVSGYLAGLSMDIAPDFVITNEASGGGISAAGCWTVNGAEFGINKINNPAAPKFNTDIDIGKPAVIIFTSGSTGRSKGVVLSQFNILSHVRHYSFVGCYEPDDVQMECLPIHHVFGLAVIFVGVVCRYKIFFPKSVEVEYVAGCIEKYRITRLDGVPSYALKLARFKLESGADLSSLRVGVIAGAPLSGMDFEFIEDTLGLKLLPVYGMSECIAISGAPGTEPREARANSVGKPIPGYDVKIEADGEITVRAPAVTPGYYRDERATAEVIDPDGRLHTGDIGYIDAMGYLHIIGRKKDIIIRNGENLSAVKIENAIKALPGVLDAAVVGAADVNVGEVPCAALVLDGDYDVVSELPRVLTKPEIPAKILLLDVLPMTASGKVDKQAVRRLFQ